MAYMPGGIFNNPSVAEGLIFQVIKIVPNCATIGARHLILAQSVLCIRLRTGGSFLVLNRALSFDADALESNARHGASLGHLAADLGGSQRRIVFTIAA